MNTTFEEYYKEIEKAYDSDELYFGHNTDRLHNAAILTLMLNKGKNVCIYCGEISFLRHNFYEYISRDNSPEEAEKAKQALLQAFHDFVNDKNKKLRIVMEKFNKTYFEDLEVDKTDLARVNLSALPDELQYKDELNHFALTDDERIVRFEQDKFGHTALLKIGTETSGPSTLETFKRLEKIAQNIVFTSKAG